MTACSQIPAKENTGSRVSRDYEAIGDASGIQPIVYGKHTLIDFSSAPIWISVKDQNGASVGYTKEGRYYSLDRVLDYFTLSTGFRKVIFKLVPLEKKAQNPLPPIASLSETHDALPPLVEGEPSLPPVLLQVQEPQAENHDQAVFRLMKKQLSQYRRMLQKAENSQEITGEELQSLQKKLDGIEKKMAAGIAIIHVQFKNRSTTIQQDEDLLDDLLPAARTAERINIYGRTSAIVAGKNDPDIALKRAQHTKQLLTDHGVAPEKIQISSLAAGDFIAPTHTKEGNILNRRAAIEIINTTL